MVHKREHKNVELVEKAEDDFEKIVDDERLIGKITIHFTLI